MAVAAVPPQNPNAPPDLTGSYHGTGGVRRTAHQRMPHVIPNPFDNTILIQGTPQEYEQILRTACVNWTSRPGRC